MNVNATIAHPTEHCGSYDRDRGPKTATDVASAPHPPSALEEHAQELSKVLHDAISLVDTLRNRLQRIESAFGMSKPSSPEGKADARVTPVTLPQLASEIARQVSAAHDLLEQLGKFIP